VRSPYTLEFQEAFLSAQLLGGAGLAAAAWWRMRSGWGRALLAGSIAAAVAPALDPRDLGALGGLATPATLFAASIVLLVAASLATRRARAAIALAVAAALAVADLALVASLPLLGVLHLAGIGVVLGACRARPARPWPREMSGARLDDFAIFLSATTFAAWVGQVVLRDSCNSDEWAYTYQAAIFAKLRAYAAAPACPTAHQSFWVYWRDGRSFAQYTPGWPLVMAPFFAAGAPWLAAPVTHGLLAVGTARLARRAASARRRASARAAGFVGGASVAFGATLAMNGGSRMPHTLLCAAFAWSVELACAARRAPGARAWRIGLLLGAIVALAVAARPADGALLSLGVGLALVRQAAQGRRSAPLGAALAFLPGTALAAVILRLQLGEWFRTGYSLLPQFHPWARVSFSVPALVQAHKAVPLDTAAYAWWPCSLGLGLFGLAGTAPRARPMVWMLVLGTGACVAFYALLEFGRLSDFAYGPRYQMPVAVPMAVGTGALVGFVFDARRRRVEPLAGLAVVAILASGTLLLSPRLYPWAHEDARFRTALFDAIREADVHHAAVLVPEGALAQSPIDVTHNLPTDLYPNQDVLVLAARSEDDVRCVRALYPDRSFFRAEGPAELPDLLRRGAWGPIRDLYRREAPVLLRPLGE
jgi:hypothetical protein